MFEELGVEGVERGWGARGAVGGVEGCEERRGEGDGLEGVGVEGAMVQ